MQNLLGKLNPRVEKYDHKNNITITQNLMRNMIRKKI